MSNATHNLCQNNNFGFELKTALFSNLKGLHLDFGHKSALKFWTNSPRWKVLTDFWSHLSPIRSMCINLDPFGPIWTHLDPFGPIWTHLDPFGFIWTNWNPIKTHFCYVFQTRSRKYCQTFAWRYTRSRIKSRQD